MPRARRSRLVVRKLDDEVLVYDLERQEAHCLNPSAAAIWKACDGRRTVAEIAARAGESLGESIGNEAVWFGIQELAKRGLIGGEVGSKRGGGISRRNLVKLGLTTAALIPLVTSIVAPEAADAATACTTPGNFGVCTGAIGCCCASNHRICVNFFGGLCAGAVC